MKFTASARSREHLAVLAAALAAPPALLALGWILRPDPRGWGTHEQLGFQPCFPMAHWRVPCPGCGVTTAVVLAVRGSVLDSLRTQPFGLVVVATAVAAAAWSLRGHLRGRDLRDELARLPRKRLGWAYASLLLVSWAWKLALVRGWLG